MLKRVLGIFIIILSVFSLASKAETITTVTDLVNASNNCTAKFVVRRATAIFFEIHCPNAGFYTHTIMDPKPPYNMTFYNGKKVFPTEASIAYDYELSGIYTNYNINKIPKKCVTWSSTPINIGMSCNGENWCAEAFSRNCSANGGTTEYSFGAYKCVTKACSSWVSIPKTPICSTTTINIGLSCNQSYCNEQFGRTCASAGGSTAWVNNAYACQKTTCTTP